MEPKQQDTHPEEFVDLDNIDAFEMPNPEGEGTSDK
jgi:hypothetical protein